MTLADELNSVAVITVLQFESLKTLYWFATSTAFSNCGLRVPTFSSTSSIRPCAKEGPFPADTMNDCVEAFWPYKDQLLLGHKNDDQHQKDRFACWSLPEERPILEETLPGALPQTQSESFSSL